MRVKDTNGQLEEAPNTFSGLKQFMPQTEREHSLIVSPVDLVGVWRREKHAYNSCPLLKFVPVVLVD